jgi:hypothetical protein
VDCQVAIALARLSPSLTMYFQADFGKEMNRLAQTAPIQCQQFLQNSFGIFAGLQAILAIA